MSFRFALLDPRSIPAATAANDAIFASAPQGVLGIEVTIATLAARCSLGNLDPQHAGGDVTRAAIEEALTAALPPEGAVLATVRADADALGSMALLVMRAEGLELADATLARVGRIAAADKSDRGPWAPKPLPTAETPWPAEAREYAALAACVNDFKSPIETRVATMRRWLETGETPSSYLAVVDRERAEAARALAAGEIKVMALGLLPLAIVESTHRAAMGLGYTQRPIVVARNPSFKLGAGEPHVKYTIAQAELGWVDLPAVQAELAALEPGWGGSPTIIGSPQGVSSSLTLEQVTDVIARHLKSFRCADCGAMEMGGASQTYPAHLCEACDRR